MKMAIELIKVLKSKRKKQGSLHKTLQGGIILINCKLAIALPSNTF
jgi:hypothetical protein